MNDSEIIKALECCSLSDCMADCIRLKCPFFIEKGFNRGCGLKDEYNGKRKLYEYALDLIHRQQAEIESLKNANGLFEYLNYAAHHYVINGKTWTQEFATIEARNKAIQDKVVLLSDIQTAKSEAVREFAEKLKENSHQYLEFDKSVFCDVTSSVKVEAIDQLFKEMIGAKRQ